jgi:hypoxanthine phosphoribosyltransferase
MVDAPKNVPHVQYTWEQFDADVEKIARAVEASGKKFRYVFGLSRGGLTLAVCLSHRLDLEFYPGLEVLRDLNREESDVQRYQSMQMLDDSKTPQEIVREKIDGVLIVDDLADAGKQLLPYLKRNFFIATLHKKPWSEVIPNVWLHEETRWIDYPWEKKRPL